jgi:hypothetical protein
MRPVLYGLLGALVAAVFSAAAFALVGDSIGEPAQDVLLPTSASEDGGASPRPSRSPDDDPSASGSHSPSRSEPGDDNGGDSDNSGPGGGSDSSGPGSGGDDSSGSGGGDDSSGHGSGDD